MVLALGRTTDSYSTFQIKYHADPVGFVRDCIEFRGDGPTAYQIEGLETLVANRRFSLRGPHGLGKTAFMAWVILWFSLTRDGTDWKIPTTASAWRQLTKFLWPEIHKWARRIRWDKVGREPFSDRTELLTQSLKLQTGEAFALASDNSAMIEGAHADHIMYVFDESKIIPDSTWESAEGAMSVGDAYWVAVSTPGEPMGQFYQIHRRAPGFEDWKVRHVTRQEAIDAGRMDEAWAEQRKRQWGEASAAYQNRVEGEFASADADGVIPLAWVERANERWHDWKESEKDIFFTCLGADVGMTGDATVFAFRHGWIIDRLQRFAKGSTMETAGRIVAALNPHTENVKGEKKDLGYAVVDSIGIGAGVLDRLKEQRRRAIGFVASGRTDRMDHYNQFGFTNMRSMAWWNMRELLDPEIGQPIALPPDDKLTGDLTAPRWREMSGGNIQVESKADIRKRIGRSTDDGDAVIMAFAPVRTADLPDQPAQRSKWLEEAGSGSRWKRY